MSIEGIDFGCDNALFNNYFESVQVLKTSAYFTSMLVLDKRDNKSKYELQIINKQQYPISESANFVSHLKLVSSLNSPQILKILDVFSSGTHLFVLSEHAPGVTLQELFEEKLKSRTNWFNSNQIDNFLNSLLKMLHYFLSKNFIHQNIRPENIIIPDKENLCSFRLRIWDFWNESRKDYLFMENGQDFRSFLYMAPELFGDNHNVSKNSDIWSVGVIFCNFFTMGIHPFHVPVQTFSEYFASLKSKKIEFSYDFPAITKSLICKMIHHDPTERYSLSQINQHPYITKNPKDIIPLTNMEVWNVFNIQINFKKIFSALKFITLCSMANGGYKSPNPRYKKLIELQNKSIIQKKKEDLTDFTPEYINKLFGLPEKPVKEQIKEQIKEPEPKTYPKDPSQIILPHFFKKPRKTKEIKEVSRENLNSAQDKDSNNNDNPKSLTEITKDNSFYLLNTPKMTLNQKEENEAPTQKKRTVQKKLSRNITYEKETISFSAKIVKKAESSQYFPQESTERKPSFLIKTKGSIEELDSVSKKQRVNTEENGYNHTIKKRASKEEVFRFQPIRQNREKAKTLNPDGSSIPLRAFVIKTRNEGQLNRKTEPRTPTETRSSTLTFKRPEKHENSITQPMLRSTSIEKTLPIKKVNLSTIFSLQLIPEKQNIEFPNKNQQKFEKEVIRKNTWQGGFVRLSKKSFF